MSLNYEQNENDILNKLLPEYRQHSVQRKSNPEAVTGHIGESEAELRDHFLHRQNLPVYFTDRYSGRLFRRDQ